MLWLSASLVALVSNLDNLSVGFAFGLQARRFTTGPNSVIALVTMAGTAGAMFFGQGISRAVSPSLGDVLGSVVIIAVGVWTLAASLVTLCSATTASGRDSNIDAAVPDLLSRALAQGRGTISSRQAIPLGLALAINNVGVGVGAGVAGVPALATTVLAGLFSLICVGGGSQVGSSLAALVLGRWAPLLSGLILLSMGALSLRGLA